MTAYWALLFMAIIFATFEKKVINRNVSLRLSSFPVIWLVMFLVITFLIGFRFEVGGDWRAYLGYLERVNNLEFREVLLLGDPGYQILNYIAANLGGGIFAVNLMSGAFFSFGLFVLCSNQPRPMLALVAAIPYMTIVLAMGYTRQSVALGFVMIGLCSLINKSIFNFSIWILFAALFHKSAILMIPLAGLLSSKNRWLGIVWITIAVIGSYLTLLQDSVDKLYTNYIVAEYQSDGALIRIIMCVFPATFFLFYRKLFKMSIKETQLWTWFSILSFVSFILFFLTSASTAIDRVALYLLPLQLVIFSHLPEVLGGEKKSNIHWILIISCYYVSVQFVWLFFANYAYLWVPYQFYPFTLL